MQNPGTSPALQKQLGAAGDVGFKQAMQSKWVAIDKSGGEPRVVRKVDSIHDRVLEVLAAVAGGKVRVAGASVGPASRVPLRANGRAQRRSSRQGGAGMRLDRL